MNQIDSLRLVEEFHLAFGQPISDTPDLSRDGLNALRMELIREELNELSEALEARDPVATLDALTDLQYVLDGTYLSLGFHPWKNAALTEVHRSNMSKLSESSQPVLRSDGKILKGPNYTPPDLETVLTNNTP